MAETLRPIADAMRDWMVANRDWVASDIREKLKGFDETVKGLDWKGMEGDFRGVAGAVSWTGENVIGLRAGIETLIGLKLIGWVAETVANFGKITTAITAATTALRIFYATGALPATIAVAGAAAAFKGAQASGEDIARHAEMGQMPVQIDEFGNPIGYYPADRAKPAGPPLMPMPPGGPRDYHLPSIYDGAGTRAQLAPDKGRVDLRVEFVNAPPGMRVRATAAGAADIPVVDVGYAGLTAEQY